MPGPRNKKKAPKKKTIPLESSNISPEDSGPDNIPPEPPAKRCEYSDARFIDDKWNGPRVLDVAAFVESSYAAVASTEDPTCAVYAVPEFRDMILKVLPQEIALILWYNKTRKSARICPACRRFYSIGDILLPHLVDDQSGSRAEYVDPRNASEKRISGLCSFMCFGIAAYSWPGSGGAWGKWAYELDVGTRAILQGPGANIADQGMGVFMKLCRMEDLIDVVSEVFRAGCILY